MKDPLGRRWIIVWIIWGAALLLTYCNRSMIQEINGQRALLDVRNTAATFVQKNRHEIDKILTKRAVYRQPVESVQIGCLSMKNQLRALATAHNLTVLEFNIDTGQTITDSVPVSLTLVGTYADALGWLAALERDYAHAPAVQVKVQRAQGLHMPQFEVRIRYYFELAGPQMAG
jgi:hypothetical protein